MSGRVELLACETCGGSERTTHGSTRGERLLSLLEEAQAERERPGIAVSSVRCLWLCKRSCAVHVRAPGRVSYLLAELDASEEAARALLDYAVLYGASSDGAVPFRQWPDALRGHFVCRVPKVAEDESPLSVPVPSTSAAKEE